MQELLARPTDHSALEAVAYFCYQARSHLAALTAVLGGLDRLVFTGGIGANAPMVRADICADLGYLGVALDPKRNTAGARVISSAAGRVVVEAFATDEEQMIAQHMRRLLAAQPARQVA